MTGVLAGRGDCSRSREARSELGTKMISGLCGGSDYNQDKGTVRTFNLKRSCLRTPSAAITPICDALLRKIANEKMTKHESTKKHAALNKDKGATKLALTK